jgi:ATP/ADP translocase
LYSKKVSSKLLKNLNNIEKFWKSLRLSYLLMITNIFITFLINSTILLKKCNRLFLKWDTFLLIAKVQLKSLNHSNLNLKKSLKRILPSHCPMS